MSELHTYKSYIEYLIAEARTRPLDNLAAGILYVNRQVAELKAENEHLCDLVEDVRAEAADSLLKEEIAKLKEEYGTANDILRDTVQRLSHSKCPHALAAMAWLEQALKENDNGNIKKSTRDT